MGESAARQLRDGVDLPPSNQTKPRSIRAPKLTKFAYCVDSIKENFKKIGVFREGRRVAGNVDKVPIEVEASVPDYDMIAGNDDRKKNGCKENKTAFEMYLSTIPRLDPVDRTVGWVLTQPEDAVS